MHILSWQCLNEPDNVGQLFDCNRREKTRALYGLSIDSSTASYDLAKSRPDSFHPRQNIFLARCHSIAHERYFYSPPRATFQWRSRAGRDLSGGGINLVCTNWSVFTVNSTDMTSSHKSYLRTPSGKIQ